MIQMVTGIVVAVVGVWWRKAKRKGQDKLGVDENPQKRSERRRCGNQHRSEEGQTGR